MEWQEISIARKRLASEQGAIIKDWGGRLPVALVYPNAYNVGMSGLGFQTVYGQLNALPGVLCERAFAEPVPGHRQPITIETQRPLSDFAVLAFSVTYELDYWNVVAVLRAAGLPPLAAERDDRHPLVIGGGPALTGNPAPLAGIFDAIVIGESEPVLPGLMAAIEEGMQGKREELLETLGNLPGVYVPASERQSAIRNPQSAIRNRQYGVYVPGQSSLLPADRQIRRETAGSGDSAGAGFGKGKVEPETWNVERAYAPDLDAFATTSVVLTRQTEFGDMYLIEVARGCRRGCRFCMARSITGPVRQRSVANLLAQAKEGLQYRRKIGLVGAATSDYPQMAELVAGLRGLGSKIGVSSLRADSLTPELLRALVESGTRTITLAPEAGSQRLRRRIGKGLSEADLRRAAELCRAQKVPAVKLYFMVGLPGETEDDVLDIARLSQEIAAWSGSKITVSVAPFVPKAQTPYQNQAMLDTVSLQQRLSLLQKACRAVGLGYKAEGVEWSAVQGVLARGDRRLAQVLLAMQANTLAEWQRAMGVVGLQAADYLQART